MARIMTLGAQSRRYVLRGTAETIIPDFRDIAFDCNFVSDAVNGAPKIRVSVGEVFKGKPSEIRIEIIPPETTTPGTGLPGTGLPGTTGPLVTEVTFEDPSRPPAVVGRGVEVLVSGAPTTLERDAAPELPVEGDTVADPGVVTDPGGATPPGTVEMVNDHRGPIRGIDRVSGDMVVFEDPFPPPNDPLPPFEPPQPPGGGGGGGGREVIERDLVPGTDPGGRWRVRLHNLADHEREFFIDVDYPESVQSLVTTRVPFQLVNRSFAEALLLMRPYLFVNKGRATLQFTGEFKKLTGIDDVVTSVNDRLENIALESLSIRLGREPQFGMPAVMVGLELEERGDEVDVFGPDGNIGDMSLQLALVLWLLPPPTTNFFATAVQRHNGTVIPRRLLVLATIAAHPDLQGIWVNVLDWLKDVLGGDSFDDTIKDMVSKAQASLNTAMRDGGAVYVQDVLTHLVERDHVIHSITADATDLIVQHHALYDPLGRFNLPDGGEVVVLGDDGSPPEGSPAGTPGVIAGPALGDESPAVGPVVTTPVRPPFGPLLPDVGPPEIGPVTTDPDPAPVATQVEHIVFLMMENRSFDHMLGYRALKGHDVRGLAGNEQNAIPDGNRPYRVKHLTKTKGIPSPCHEFHCVAEQVAEGAMTGFAANYARRSAVTDPGLAMGYYTEAELPMYEFAANNFAICDAWYASHPGPTWPNRFCATTGATPEIDNFDIGDDRIGYFNGTSIFDVLNRFGVDWCYAEGNIAFLRMFDRYRLDIRNVIPFTDDFQQGIADTWENRVKTGRLPAVSYIDPRYIDVPPSFDANDDLPPTDVCFGQQLVRRIYNLLKDAPTWSGTLFVVTYDEHGGFFDHVAPPGTPPADDPSPQPQVHRDGAVHLGVRVPALVISPWVDAGTVVTTLLDHTSIIKTILHRFAPAEHADGALFGPRTQAANSLLDELRATPRTDRPVAPQFTCASDVRARGPASALERDDFHTGMRFLALPADRREALMG
jgi:phospholipase C